jgi:hypothetical protein
VREVSDTADIDEMDLCFDLLRASVTLSEDFFTPATISTSAKLRGKLGYLRFFVFEGRQWEKLPS